MIFIIMIVAGILGGIIASSKGRSVVGWAIGSALLPIVLLILLALPRTDRAPLPSDSMTCPRCAETIKAAAQVCRFCGHRFDDHGGSGTGPAHLVPPAAAAEPETPPSRDRADDDRRTLTGRRLQRLADSAGETGWRSALH